MVAFWTLEVERKPPELRTPSCRAVSDRGALTTPALLDSAKLARPPNAKQQSNLIENVSKSLDLDAEYQKSLIKQ